MDRKQYQHRKKLERKQTHKRIEIQLTNREYAQFQKIAQQESTTVNHLIKNMAIAYRDTKFIVPAQLQEPLNQLTFLIRNIAGNLNQLSHSANIFRDIDRDRVFEHLASLDDKVQDFVKGKLK